MANRIDVQVHCKFIIGFIVVLKKIAPQMGDTNKRCGLAGVGVVFLVEM